MPKTAVPYIAGIDNSISCFDCSKRESSESFEPCFRLDTVTGEILHVMICADCIDDIETVHNADVVRVIGKYAAKVRRTRDYRHAHANGYASITWMHTIVDALPILEETINA